MNKLIAKTITLQEKEKILPKWWLDIFQTTIFILKHNKFVSYKQIEQFVKASLQFQPMEEISKFKRIVVKVENKGERNGLIYITIVIFFIVEKKNSWKLTKSFHIKKRNSISANYD